MEIIKSIFDQISVFDFIYLTITIFYLFRCSIKGFILSLLSAAKWLLAYVLTLIMFPKIKPYVKDVLDNEYISDKLPLDNRKSFTFSYVKKGSNYLIKEFPSKKEYEDAKEKVSDI